VRVLEAEGKTAKVVTLQRIILDFFAPKRRSFLPERKRENFWGGLCFGKEGVQKERWRRPPKRRKTSARFFERREL